MSDSYNLGSANPRALLSEDEVLEIHRLAWSGRYTQDEIGKMYGVTHRCVSTIKLGVRWAHLFEVCEQRRTDQCLTYPTKAQPRPRELPQGNETPATIVMRIR